VKRARRLTRRSRSIRTTGRTCSGLAPGKAAALAEETGDRRFRDYWHFVYRNEVEVYIQRVFDASNTARGYRFKDLEAQGEKGIPVYLLTRTSPRIVGWEQTQESKPWYTKVGAAGVLPGRGRVH
jgi:hypothetical protein